jgi:hypothetical protein
MPITIAPVVQSISKAEDFICNSVADDCNSVADDCNSVADDCNSVWRLSLLASVAAASPLRSLPNRRA